MANRTGKWANVPAGPKLYAKRRSRRWPIEVSSVVTQPRLQRQVPAEMYDLSPIGCRFVSDEPFEPGSQVLIRMQGLEDWPGTVIWCGPEGIGVEFHVPLNSAVLEHYIRTHSPQPRQSPAGD